jgi:hypothetical protein
MTVLFLLHPLMNVKVKDIFYNTNHKEMVRLVLGNRWLENKENLTKSNVDLSNLKKKKSKKKRQRTDQVVVQRTFIFSEALGFYS